MPGRCQDPPLERCRGEHFVRVSENGTRKAQGEPARQEKQKPGAYKHMSKYFYTGTRKKVAQRQKNRRKRYAATQDNE